MQADALPLSIGLPSGSAVSGLLLAPKAPTACYVFAHGAGAGMQHRFMADLAGALCCRGIATLRFQFPYMENASRRPDRPEVAHEAVRAAAAEAAQRLPGVPLFAGGKSFGGRMTSQAQADRPMAGVAGLVFVGFPLHPAGKPGTDRAAHLSQVQVPMLFLQGDRDELAAMDLLRPEVERLGARASLHVIAGADHAFHVLARSGRKDPEVIEELADVMARWIGALGAEQR